ncbi:unnamed protein product [Owenia fusiformis]|uniref:C-type lectin n=1 Tax=Owenia fusiformis TaxID=6347 RepID=A0A8S4NQZ3_OWEFU|nr:unnamed protein product [Owenia fusiformis]
MILFISVYFMLSSLLAFGQDLPPYEPCDLAYRLEQRGDFCFWHSSNDGAVGQMNFFEANQQCQLRGAKLATPNTQDIAEWFQLRQDVVGRRQRDYWIGGLDEPWRNGSYYWLDGTPWDQAHANNFWAVGEPSGPPNHCIALAGRDEIVKGYWDDRHCYNDDLDFICQRERRRVCTCSENESKFCDIGFGCTSFRVCESGLVITVQCAPGEVADSVNQTCAPANEVQAPCGQLRSCAGFGNASVPIYDNMCHTYYRCENDQWQEELDCPEGEIWDEIRQSCESVESTCEPCGHSSTTPDGSPCPGPRIPNIKL